MYKVKILPKPERQLKKLTRKNRKLAEAFRTCIDEIRSMPRRESKVGDLKGLWGHGFRFQQVDYRVAYIIDEGHLYVFIIGVGSHEGFWQEVKKYWHDQ